MIISPGEVWFVSFPLEEEPSRFLPRPVIVLDEETLQVLSVKVTSSDPRKNDKYDIPIIHWEYAQLRYKSTARVSKTMYLPKSQFKRKVGNLHPEDFEAIVSKFEVFIEDIS